jgi:protein-S-isoprenylcysteine O-methyltransferase Ste14
MKLNFVTLAVAILFAVIFVKQAWGLPYTVPRIVGLAIVIPALLHFVLARIQLGRAFSLQAKADILVTTGPYPRIRNPIYFFGELMIAGVIVWANRPRFFLCFAVLIPLQIYRSRKEEQVLNEKFGAAYLDFKRQTWF